MDLDLPNVQVSTSSHIYTWKLDTCASTHMTSEIKLFEQLESYVGTIRVGGDKLLLSEGIGTVLLNASLPDGSFNTLRLKSVLYVPSLCHSLVSWARLSEKGYMLTASGKFGFVSKDKCTVFMTELRDNLPFIREKLITVPMESSLLSTHTDMSTHTDTSTHTDASTSTDAFTCTNTSTHTNSYLYWHQSLGHSSNVQQSAYQDGQLIPTAPAEFICNTCIMSKSTNSVPKGLESSRTTRPFEIIYSDLSCKQATPTYGNSLYYIIFIDDYTRMAWIFFLKNKSDTSKVIQKFVTYVER